LLCFQLVVTKIIVFCICGYIVVSSCHSPVPALFAQHHYHPLVACSCCRYERLEAQVGECYEGSVELVPSPEDLADLFAHVGTA
jgi:hypothetical protein